MAGVWAQENTRESIYDAMARKETFGTSGTHIKVRFFGGWDFSAADVGGREFVQAGYARGVPMGGDLAAASKGKAPSFMVWAIKDPLSGNLDRIQIVKGWVDAGGAEHEKIYDVAWSGNRKPDAKGKLPAVGNTVDPKTGSYKNSIGSPELSAVWKDPEFDAGRECVLLRAGHRDSDAALEHAGRSEARRRDSRRPAGAASRNGPGARQSGIRRGAAR